MTDWSTSLVARGHRGAALLMGTPRPPVGQTPNVVIHRHDKLVVRYYAPRGTERRAPIVLVPSLINKAYILDLEPDRSVVTEFADRGHPTYLIDWGVPQPEDADEDVRYVLDELLARSLRRIRRHARQTPVALGYCMGGTLLAMGIARHPDLVRGLILLAAPFRFSEAGRFREFVADFDPDTAIGPDGLVPVSVMQPAFKLLDPMGNWTKLVALEKASHDPVRLRRSLARERWLEENVPMPGAFAREFIGRAYQDDALLDGAWEIDGQAIDLSRITVPTLVVACERDFIAPAACVLPVADVLPNATAEVLPTGHIGVVVGGYGPKVFVPRVSAFAETCFAENAP
ncbi:MAG: alpha/beta fold hydrolase [Proteobacteria bacterium]|nr:alpha/beta fold hydrolase [Pseudomonadota bacterium]MCP4915922.1 alpha/beta fold hydrolase [Pseudomonadota bacterium]